MSAGFETSPSLTKNLAGRSLDTHPPARQPVGPQRRRAASTMVRDGDRRGAPGRRPGEPIIAAMILAVDCGNSAVKVALVDGPQVHRSARLEDAPERGSEEALHALIEDLLATAPVPPAGLLVASVVDRWTSRVERIAT